MKYEDGFETCRLSVTSTVKMRVIQAVVQIDRPVNWTIENVRRLALSIKSLEQFCYYIQPWWLGGRAVV